MIFFVNFRFSGEVGWVLSLGEGEDYVFIILGGDVYIASRERGSRYYFIEFRFIRGLG